ncbi:MAG: FTR1 family protein [Dokdonella sp.]
MIMRRVTCLALRLTSLILVCAAMPSAAQTADATSVPQTWQMLDYLATDYAGAVKDGAVSSPSEYAEMREFAATARARIGALSPTTVTPDLLAQADALIASIDSKAAPLDVGGKAHALADSLLNAYPIPTVPEHTPDLATGASVYQSRCASCHGATGHGDGPAGLQLEPRPVDFTDQARADQRSVLSLYQVVTQGVTGTPMASYAHLPVNERWALAYYVGSLAYEKQAVRGAKNWSQDTKASTLIAGPGELTRVRVAQLVPTLGTDPAREIVGYLRAHPDLVEKSPQGLSLARGRIAASVAAYKSGAKSEATQLALSAYLDGVEPVEPQLNARDSALRAKLETDMGVYRSALSSTTQSDTIERQAADIDALLARAQQITANGAGGAMATFLGAYTIFVREGMEALLVIVALLAFLRKANRNDAVRVVHAAWILALVAGFITWAVATYAVSISGASREVTEGLSSLFAAALLLSVGLWMHQKSIGGRWQAYLKEKMAGALTQRSAWFLFGLAFISVYREVFETILFYAALWSDGDGLWLLGGIAAGAATLGFIAWVLLRTSRRLPIGTFFSASSALIAVLAIVLSGKGIAALQEAGWIAVTVVSAPRIELFGVYPTLQSLLAQLAVVGLLAAGFWINISRNQTPVEARS